MHFRPAVTSSVGYEVGEMISGMTVMLSKSFVYPSSSGLLTNFRNPRLFSQPISRTVNYNCKQTGQAPSASTFLIFADSSFRVSTFRNYEQFSRNTVVVKPHSKPWTEEARFDQHARCKDFPIRSFSSQSEVSQGIELAPFYKRKERALKRSRNATASGQGDRSSRTSISGDQGLSPVSSQEKRVPQNSKTNDSEPVRSELSSIEQSMVSDMFRVERAPSKLVGEDDTSQQKTAFDQWAVHKLREDGLSSLTVIEDMRQVFVPGSPPLDPRLLFSEAEFRELEIRTIANRNYQLKSTRSNHRDEKSSSTSISQLMPMGSKPSPRKSSEERTIENQTAESKSSVAGTPHPKPLVVKRRTILPENWNGPGGTIVLIDKPQGWTSFAVCGKLRHTLKIQKVGHSGTLDPMATGLLIVCLGKATKLADSYQAMTKVYSGIFRLGEDTPSLDADTKVSDTLPWEHVKDEDIERAKQAFVGDILQSPPMYSAVKVKGERLYAKARRGEEIVVPARAVKVHEFEVSRSPDNRQEFQFRVTCSKGTYVRSLCSDLGRALGSYAHLTALRREKIGSYSVSDAWRIEELVENYIQQYHNVRVPPGAKKSCSERSPS